MTETLYLKYRPNKWSEVIGQKSAVISIRRALKKDIARTFLLTGPSGVGKTTIARLIAKEVGCSDENVYEIDGATNTGIDDMREVARRLSYSTMDGTPRCVIIDEVHAVSQQALKSLLKILEEPPEGVYWVLCTTEASKVPKVVKTRCLGHDLKPVPVGQIYLLLRMIKKKENYRISAEGLTEIVEVSNGSVRQAISFLAACSDFKKVALVKKVLAQDAESTQAIDLCRLLLSVATGGKVRWRDLATAIKALETPPETTRIIVMRYMAAVILGGNVAKAGAALGICEHFMEPFVERDGNAPLVVAVGNAWAVAVNSNGDE